MPHITNRNFSNMQHLQFSLKFLLTTTYIKPPVGSDAQLASGGSRVGNFKGKCPRTFFVLKRRVKKLNACARIFPLCLCLCLGRSFPGFFYGRNVLGNVRGLSGVCVWIPMQEYTSTSSACDLGHITDRHTNS